MSLRESSLLLCTTLQADPYCTFFELILISLCYTRYEKANQSFALAYPTLFSIATMHGYSMPFISNKAPLNFLPLSTLKCKCFKSSM